MVTNHGMQVLGFSDLKPIDRIMSPYTGSRYTSVYSLVHMIQIKMQPYTRMTSRETSEYLGMESEREYGSGGEGTSTEYKTFIQVYR